MAREVIKSMMGNTDVLFLTLGSEEISSRGGSNASNGVCMHNSDKSSS